MLTIRFEAWSNSPWQCTSKGSAKSTRSSYFQNFVVCSTELTIRIDSRALSKKTSKIFPVLMNSRQITYNCKLRLRLYSHLVSWCPRKVIIYNTLSLRVNYHRLPLGAESKLSKILHEPLVRLTPRKGSNVESSHFRVILFEMLQITRSETFQR